MPAIHLGATHASRYREHYDATLESDVMYMTYNHRATATAAAAAEAAATIKAAKPVLKTGYESNRPTPMPRGNRPLRPVSTGVTPDSVPRLESITLHTMVKEAITNKHQLLGAIMAFRAISGESTNGGGRKGSSGVQVVVARTGAANFKLRAGMPVSAKVELRGEAMYDFIQSLVDFVLPRIREFPGFLLPPQSASKTSPSALAGVVSVGLPPGALGFFPQIEANIDAYSKLYGFHIHFKTNLKGKDAQEHARALLTGFRIPFYRK
jgi:large subunit ribosomal protein L5